MPLEPLKIVRQAALALATAGTLRDRCAAALSTMASDMGTSFVFLARVAQDRGIADVIASSGLHAADFRRLEDRLPKSSLWRILHANTAFVIDDLAQDPVLNFLAYSTRAETLLALPVRMGQNTPGFVAAAFPGVVGEAKLLKVLETITALFAHSMSVDQTVVLDNARLLNENRRLKSELKERYDFGNLIGNSGGMRQALDQVRQIARSNAAVLLRGEAGTGKDTFANAIRYNSLRSKRPFVKVDFAITSGSQQSQELEAALDAAESGTVYINEIASATAEVQRSIVAIIRDIRSATRDRPPAHNVRLILASGSDLIGVIGDELAAFVISLPPLRERKSDVLLLADHFLERIAAAEGKNILRISTPAIDMLTAYHFPGNVRELENVIEHAVTACDSNVVHGHHLPPTLQTAEVTGTETVVTLDAAVATFERDLIQDALKSTRGNVAKAARMLDSTERILGYKIKKYALDPHRFKKWR
jgi:Nif-specific regulatory protein